MALTSARGFCVSNGSITDLFDSESNVGKKDTLIIGLVSAPLTTIHGPPKPDRVTCSRADCTFLFFFVDHLEELLSAGRAFDLIAKDRVSQKLTDLR